MKKSLKTRYDSIQSNHKFQYMAESVPSLNRKRGLKLPVHGNERTMNLNHLILANITESAYFRTDLVQFRQFDELVDEIYYRANHLEPWEKVKIFKYSFFISLLSGSFPSMNQKGFKIHNF